MATPLIYLDYNATAPIRPAVAEEIARLWTAPLNPSSIHRAGREAKRLLQQAREAVAASVSCFPHELIFTASGSEANNLALHSAGERPLFVGATEHSSISQPAMRLGADSLPVDKDGLIDKVIMAQKLASVGRPAFVSIMLANNETGVIQPMAELAAIAHEYGAILHVDAVQAHGKTPVDMGLLGADMLTIAAHKMGGPVGVGALAVRDGIAIKPAIMGGSQEAGKRAGTENVPLLCGWAKAIELTAKDHWQQPIGAATKEAASQLQAIAPELVIVGEGAARLPHVLCLMLPGMKSETQLMHLDLAGISVSAGSACSSGRVTASPVLQAMGYSEAEASCALRLSAGWQSKPEDIEAFAHSWLMLYERLKKAA